MLLYLSILFVSLTLLLKKKNNTVKSQFNLPKPEFKTVSEGKTSFSVLSYNILAYKFTRLDWFPKVEPEVLHPKFRAPRILQEIQEIDADILGLQECDLDLFLDYYLPNLKAAGYDCIFKNSSNQKNVVGVLCYKTSKFTLNTSKVVNLDEELVNLCESFSRHREAQFAQLYHKESGKYICVVNTHLYWNPDFEYVKYGELMKILEFVQKQPKKAPLVLMGDFNSLPDSNVVKFVYKVPPKINKEIKGDFNKNKHYMETFYKENLHSLSLKSSYAVYQSGESLSESHPEFTNYTDDFKGCLDYIFYSDDSLVVRKLLKIPCNDVQLPELKLPCYKYPSDHLKICTQFSFKDE